LGTPEDLELFLSNNNVCSQATNFVS